MLEPFYISTPERVFKSQSEQTITMKLECLQASGSFKDRGMSALCRYHAQMGVERFIIASGGNAGLAAAHACRLLKKSLHVIVPETTKQEVIVKIQSEGALVTVHGKDWNATASFARHEAEQSAAEYLSPYDHPMIWEGNATMIHELTEQPEAIILSVGGGGLFSGVMLGLEQRGWMDTEVIAVETEGSASFAASFNAQKIKTLETITSIATSLGAKSICQQAFDYSQKMRVHSCTVTDAASIQACHQFANEYRLLVEPACGASLSLIYDQHPILKQYASLLIIVCGGSGVSLSHLQRWKQELSYQSA